MSDGIRAVRNNNPGNIEKGAPWQGLMPANEMTPDQADEHRFCVFQSPKWGFRALARVLITYQDKHNIHTIAGAIARWAPTSENDTKSYVNHVSRLTGRAFNEQLNFHDYSDLAPIAKAITTHECGGWFFDDSDLEEGMRLAGVIPPAKVLVESRTIKAATAASVVTGTGLIVETVSQLSPAATLIREIATYAPVVAGVLVLGVLFAIIYYRFDDWKRAKR